jgi:hypothetical protein
MNGLAISTRRLALAAALIATVAFAATAPAAAQAVTVNVDGQPLMLNPGPIEQAGRVFVPLRGIFERLGASVVYQAGTINATKGQTTVSLRIGSTQATVNGETQNLDVAAFIVGSTTYVPLRFVAQSLGAHVGYDNSTRVVAIDLPGRLPPNPMPRPPMPPPNPPPSAIVRLRAQQPEPGANVRDRFVTIAAEFSHRVAQDSVRVWLDGNNITNRSGVSASGFSYKPPASLDFGSHTVRVSGRAPGGSPFDHSWSFTVRRPAGPVMHLTIDQPSGNAPVGRNFTITGNTVANGSVEVTAGATPSATGQFRGSTTAGPRGNFRLQVTLKRLMGQQAVTVRIVATDPATSQSTETKLQLRLNP